MLSLILLIKYNIVKKNKGGTFLSVLTHGPYAIFQNFLSYYHTSSTFIVCPHEILVVNVS